VINRQVITAALLLHILRVFSARYYSLLLYCFYLSLVIASRTCPLVRF